MNTQKQSKLSTQVVLLTLALLAPLFILSAMGAGLSGLEGINPENQGKTVIYPVSNAMVFFIKQMSVYFVAPLSVVIVIAAAINLKFANQLLHRSLIAVTIGTICWFLFTMWALDGTWVSSTDTSTSRNQSNSSALQIKTINTQQ